jgi:D-alanine-D-alanine ligase-like ATP-grasp enzyme
MTLLHRYALVMKFWRKVFRRLGQAIPGSRTTDSIDLANFYDAMWRDAAEQCGLTTRHLSKSVLEYRRNDEFVTRTSDGMTMLDNPVTLMTAGDKVLTYNLLSDAGLPVPNHRVFCLKSLETVKSFISEHRGPFVIKPARGTSSGKGVTTNLLTFKQCVNAAILAATYSDDLLIEQFVVGECYRLLFVGLKLSCIARRSGVRVVGNGERSLAQLVEVKCPNYFKQTGIDPWHRGSDLAMTCSAQGYGPEQVLGKGKTALVTSRPLGLNVDEELRTVYTEDVTGLVCDEIVEDANRACRILHSELAGIDIITTDPSVSLRASAGVIGEVNTTPGLIHHYNIEGIRREESAATDILRYMMEKNKSGVV